MMIDADQTGVITSPLNITRVMGKTNLKQNPFEE
jgi:hypothetical protein